MKKNFTILLLLLMSFGLHAQTYNNEWIDFSKTYFKFKVGADGLYRIPQSVLANAGLNNTPAENFQLFRNGVEVPIYTSIPTGIFGPSDYIEFYGRMNDGKPDKQLYRSPSYQHTDKWSLQTDTAVYFLTVNNSGPVFHFANTSNDTTGNVLPVEPYFMYKAGTYFRSQLNLGYAIALEQYIYSSSYDIGEFWSSNNISQYTPFVSNLSNLFIYGGGPNAYFQFGAAGAADTIRHIQVKINNTLVKDTVMNGLNDLQSSAIVPLGTLNTSSTDFQFINSSPAVTFSDRMVISYFELTYPRQFNFGGASSFDFELPAKPSGYYLKINNFTFGSVAPVLYDATTGQRFTAVLDAGNVPTFLLPGSLSTRKMVLVSEDPSTIKTIGSLTTKNFVRFNDPANQGNYIIISNTLLYTGTHGNNPVVDYKNYRSSAPGGGFNTQIVDIDELVDQFAFGIKKHPLSIKNFLNYARSNYSVKPEFVFLIGRGMAYNDYRYNESSPSVDALNPVPTFGFPASDMMLSSQDGAHPVALTPIGRLAAISGSEVEIYLDKVKEYEQVQQTAPNTIAARAWMKNIMHVTGATDPYLESILCAYMSVYRGIIIDTAFGANVYTFCSSNLTDNNQVSAAQFPQLFSNGIGILTYFGHSSSSVLGFNLDDPSVYNNSAKYPVFYVNGCYAGNFYSFDPTRLGLGKTLSETYVLAKGKGSIAFVASTHYGIVNYLNLYLNELYAFIGNTDYGKPIGVIQADAAQKVINLLPQDFLARAQSEEMGIHGDPAVKITTSSLADYDIELSQVKISPAFISVADNSFTVNATIYNLGKYAHDSITVLITRKYPNGTTSVVRKRLAGISFLDSISVTFPIVATRDKGQNTITIVVNSDNDVPETTLNNNTVNSDVFIYEDELNPVYPYDYAIINKQNQKLYASTANPFAPSTQYAMEIDTTELFNSPLKVSKNITSIGGILEFDPGINYIDSTVYYWRTSIVPTGNNLYHWNEFSFVYIDSNASGPGFNQSHYYQHLQSTGQGISVNSRRQWQFSTHPNNLFIKNGVFPTAASNANDFAVEINGNTTTILSVCGVSGIIFHVFDSATFKPWLNSVPGSSQYGSDVVCGVNRKYNFQFNILDTAKRRAVVNFMDLIPDGAYVVVKNISGTDPASNTYASDWAKDTSYLGSGNSMYLRLLGQGFTGIDSFNQPRAFIFVYQKNRQNTFTPRFVFSQGITDKIFLSDDDYVSFDSVGFVTSPLFGPAKQWKQVHWRGSSLENPSTDSVGVTVVGVDTAGNQTNLYNLALTNQDYDISSVNPAQYPYLQLKMKTVDTTHVTPYQLKYWRINYVPVPEGALAPNIFLSGKDSLELGEKLEFGIAFKNISMSAFDSMRITLNITDKNNITHSILIPKKRPIVSGDTLKIMYEIDTKDYPGLNTIFLDVNPNNDQPEQYHFNNFLYKNFYVRVDKTNPLLDVTFDNVHILNDDIVSAKPHILIKLKDEAKFLLLNDTALLKVQVRYPDQSLHPYYFNSDTLRFTPATSSADNTASVDFYPAFTKQLNPEGDDYQLIVTGKDASGNASGTTQYQVSFKIITKAMISNMLNYPNPFTTSTAFVFTITGSEVPQNIKIQILTITGKIVREITKDELGPLHVGRNITEFKWDGTDMYHQRLANGVYLYHVVTNLNGKSLDKYKSESDNTDQFFNKGYGKMYLMR
ncbi:MAG: hypothetical protein JST75_09650 [Bacteroidetes bacterium]|nr:hypothetical protein [Bacteroidota bacterium]